MESNPFAPLLPESRALAPGLQGKVWCIWKIAILKVGQLRQNLLWSLSLYHEKSVFWADEVSRIRLRLWEGC